MYLEDVTFNKCLGELVEYVYKAQGNTKLSFRSGFIWEQEGYKRDLWEESHNTRKNIAKSKNGYYKWFFETLKLTENNLISWQQKDKIKKEWAKIEGESEDLLFRIYTEPKSKDKQLFDEAVKLWGASYPIITYIFFLKDKDKYLPVRPKNFRERFGILKIEDDCLNKCTWENYQYFLSIMQEVQERLNTTRIFSRKVDLLDAHSFVWMMWLLSEVDDRQSVECDNEGRAIKYYGTRYERSAKNRAIAIKKHGYKCMACGFDFKEAYGEIGKGYIEVHHIKPLYTYGGKTEKINPETDLICLCSNCHSMIHRGKHKGNGAPMTLEELKSCYNDRESKLPNAETREAIQEVQRMKENPKLGKAYSDVDQMVEELLEDDAE